MPQLQITGWRYGLQKISMTQIIKAELGLGLANAKACTDQVLDGETVVFNVNDLSKAQEIAQSLDAIGANVEIHT